MPKPSKLSRGELKFELPSPKPPDAFEALRQDWARRGYPDPVGINPPERLRAPALSPPFAFSLPGYNDYSGLDLIDGFYANQADFQRDVVRKKR